MIDLTPPPHRLERLRAWMEDANVDACVLLGADHVAHLTGYSRYFGGPAAVVIDRAGENPEVAEAREALLAIREECAADLRPGVTGAAIFAAMRERILARFPGAELPHHAGHGVGLTSFEDPHLIPTAETPLESWMLVALEPGVYLDGRFGVRVENLYIVTPDGGAELRAALRRHAPS